LGFRVELAGITALPGGTGVCAANNRSIGLSGLSPPVTSGLRYCPAGVPLVTLSLNPKRTPRFLGLTRLGDLNTELMVQLVGLSNRLLVSSRRSASAWLAAVVMALAMAYGTDLARSWAKSSASSSSLFVMVNIQINPGLTGVYQSTKENQSTKQSTL
jgi:hypothetical protein